MILKVIKNKLSGGEVTDVRSDGEESEMDGDNPKKHED